MLLLNIDNNVNVKYIVNITDTFKANINKTIKKTIDEFANINYDRTIKMTPKQIQKNVIKILNSHLSMLALDGRENTLDTKRVVLACEKKDDRVVFTKSFYHKYKGLRINNLQKEYEKMVLEHAKASTQIILTGLF